MEHQTSLIARSILFVPANRPDRYTKALESGADIVCADLEDAISLCQKAEAREAAISFFSQPCPQDVIRALRINSLSTLDGLRDILWLQTYSLVHPDLLLLPKSGGAQDIRSLTSLLVEMGKPCPILAIIETAEGLDNASDIALSENVMGICFGSADYTAETGGTMTWDSLSYGRGRVIQAAARGNVLAFDGAWLNLSDKNGLIEESRRLPALGFDGRVVIHPRQITDVHAAFTPSSIELDHARKIMDAAQRHEGGVVTVDGRMVDAPVITRARRLLQRAKQVY